MHTPLLRSVSLLSSIAALALALGGCASTAPTASGFLPTYANFVPTTGKTHAFISPGTPRVAVDSLVVAPVECKVDREKARLTDDEVEKLCRSAQDELRRALGATFNLSTSASAPQGAVFRSAITRVDTSSAVLNAVTTAALFMPLNNGGICLEWELVDAKSGTRLASGINISTGKPWQVGAAFKKTGQATRGLRDIADDIGALLSARRTSAEIRPTAQ